MDTLDRLYRRLLEAVQHEYGADAEPPLTVAEVYQKLVPYRSVRAELGFGELAEYEHTLLRLLSGERGYVDVELEPVRDELRRELRSANPILGVYRDYAAVGVQLHAATPESGAAGEVAPPPLPELPTVEAAPRAPREAQRRAERAPVEPPPASAAPLRESPPQPVSCGSCAQLLPQGREVRFCPYCGTSQLPVPCRACGTPLEPEWAFCIRCGSPRRTAAAPLR